jgi:hypothetical protein
VSGIVAEDPEIPIELAVEFFRFQSDDYFSLPAGLDVRIEPHHFQASGVFDLGDGEQGIALVGDNENLGEGLGDPAYVAGIIVIRANGDDRTRGGFGLKNPQPENQDQGRPRS